MSAPDDRPTSWIEIETIRAVAPWRDRHRRTDPACRLHRRPRGRLSRWWFDRGRGRSCGPCRAGRPVSMPVAPPAPRPRQDAQR